MRATFLRVLLLALLPLSLVAAFGGWAAVPVGDLPDYVGARQPLDLSFMVRQQGVRPLSGLSPTVEVKSGSRQVTVAAVAGSETGQYTARLTVPEPGRWTITIHSGFGKSDVTLLPLP